MNYAIRHLTRFRYTNAISESVMEVYMKPRSEGNQRTLAFDLSVNPPAEIHHYMDYLGNEVHHFDVPRLHNRLTISAESIVQLQPPPSLPDALEPADWARLDSEVEANDFWDMLAPSHFVRTSPLVDQLAAELGVERRDDPLTVLRQLNSAIFDVFDYAPQTTDVDSPIEHALEERRGVCQDFAHVMATLIRHHLRIPCRYVSGYLYTGKENQDRSAEDATHAWVEAWLPEFGWTGFDPTNNLIVTGRHIRVAVGRDYADVPPTRGVFKGETETELSVGVQVKLTDDVPFDEDLLPPLSEMQQVAETPPQIQQQQQQQ
ncbi:MAG: transglutaminase family protein [Anaerolineae bacterium]|nr:transglutaminase family protein [Anaerolineae bacterium]